uniref:NADH dehydrogenase subunit 5 n=1 Tax=Cheiloneurus elegans TaxID=1107371 RepID=UPI00233F70B0|nr:NADH dehydrogenase subunit 5 [Cheiloneurus elegans]WBR65750.1 NADH dehydrogenase subunit 5 [Cheiloneurus elegans]
MILYYFSGVMSLVMSLLFLLFGMVFMLEEFSLFIEWSLVSLNSFNLNMLIYLDWISLLFIYVVLLIYSMIMFYCCEYMSHDLNKSRFFFLVFLFVMSMMFMIISPNMISIILGWDGLGLTSYCLVVFYQNNFSFNSGMLTVLMNRVGDIMIMMSISIMIIFGSVNIVTFNYENLILLFLIVIASFTKSAQFPFSSWLPAAMAAPTPVSSLVHSSTLVTAGIYLLIRFNNLIYKSFKVMLLLLFIGMLTMLMAGVSANFEFDLKKIIAYSTLSQLGLMVVIYSMKFYYLSYFHLIIHAMFKSMMFMCSGIIIHFMLGYQDIRYLGNLLSFFPFTMVVLMISNFSLCGLPFFSGFYSKDLILEKIFMSKFFMIMFVLMIIGTVLTLLYSVRLLYYLMNKSFYFNGYNNLMDCKLMNFSLMILFFNTVFMGKLFIYIMFLNIEEIFLLSMEKMLILMFCVVFTLLGKFLYENKFNYNMLIKFIFGKMFLLNYINKFYLLFMMKMKNYYNLFDKGLSNYLFENFLKDFMLMFNFKVMNNIYLMNFMLLMSYLLLMLIMF